MSKVESIVTDVLRVEIDDLLLNKELSEIGDWDSLRHMELIISMENEFNITFTPDEIVSMKSVNKIKDVLTNKGCCI